MEPANSYGSVSPLNWTTESRSCWIVAGGPSARSFDHRQLAGQCIIAVNDGVFVAGPAKPETVVMFSADSQWVSHHRSLLANAAGDRYVCVHLDTWPACAGIQGVTYLDRYRGVLSRDRTQVAIGGNSGYGAINLAYLLGATLIHLIGFDMDPSTKPIFRQWIPKFRDLAAVLRDLQVQVLNHNPRSCIDAFEMA